MNIAQYIDHTLLKPHCQSNEFETLCKVEGDTGDNHEEKKNDEPRSECMKKSSEEKSNLRDQAGKSTWVTSDYKTIKNKIDLRISSWTEFYP